MSSILKDSSGIWDYVPNVADPLRTAVLISLFTDAAPLPGDPVPARAPRRGWWGFTYDAIAPHPRGSRLWLLQGRRADVNTLADAKSYAEDALAWLVTAGLASAVEVTTERYSDTIVALGVIVYRPGDAAPAIQDVWELTLNGPVTA